MHRPRISARPSLTPHQCTPLTDPASVHAKPAHIPPRTHNTPSSLQMLALSHRPLVASIPLVRGAAARACCLPPAAARAADPSWYPSRQDFPSRQDCPSRQESSHNTSLCLHGRCARPNAGRPAGPPRRDSDAASVSSAPPGRSDGPEPPTLRRPSAAAAAFRSGARARESGVTGAVEGPAPTVGRARVRFGRGHRAMGWGAGKRPRRG